MRGHNIKKIHIATFVVVLTLSLIIFPSYTVAQDPESDYGAAPKVEMKLGQKITVIDPDFDFKQWLGFDAEIVDNPFLDICRSQIDVKINGCTDTLNAETKGFHWMASYGDYLKETGYALKKVGINWLNLSA